MKDVKQGNPGSPYWGGAYGMEFKVYNNYNSEVNATIKYLFNGQLQSVDSIIASKGYFVVTGPASVGLDETSIYFVINTPGLEAKKELTTLDNYTCEQCPKNSGFTCLNDGQICNDSIYCGGDHCVRGYCSDSKACFNNDCKCNSTDEIQCNDNANCVKINSVELGFKPVCRAEECKTGYINNKSGACALKNGGKCLINDDCVSGICNPARICGEFNGVCPDGEKLCNNQTCLKTSDKLAEQPYSCEWECVNGTIACNGICRAVSSKKAGQEYHCIEECESGRGDDKKCIPSIIWWVYFWIISLVAILILTLLVIHLYKKKLIIIKEEIKKLEGFIIKLNESITELSLEKEGTGKEIKKLEEEVRNSKGEAKRKYEEELMKLKEKNKVVENNLKNKQGKLKETEEELKAKEEELSKRKNLFKEENLKFQIKQALDKYNKVTNDKLRYNGEYLVFKNSGLRYHVWRYKEYLKKKGKMLDNNRFSIHHIDRNKLNNELWNLVSIDKNVHDIQNGKFIHDLIEFGDLKSGVKELIEQLKMKEKDFNEETIKKLKELKEQRTLK